MRYAACVVLATTRADVNGVVRRHLEARKASFAPMDEAVALTVMAYGAVVVGSGLRASKLELPGDALADLAAAVVLELSSPTG